MVDTFDEKHPLALGFTAAATIASFGVYRMWVGEWTKAWFDLAVVAAVAPPVIHAWRGGDSLRAGNVLAALNSAATFGACLLLGHMALTWTYLVLLTNFFIAHRWMAVACNAPAASETSCTTAPAACSKTSAN